MQTTIEKKYIGSGEDVVLADSGPYVPSDDEGVGLAINGKAAPKGVYQQEEEACCSATGE